MSLFVAPLHTLPVSRDSSIDDIVSVFFASSSIKASDIVQVKFSRNGNSVSIELQDIGAAQNASNLIKERFSDSLITKVSDIPRTAPASICNPVQYDDARVPPGFLVFPEYLTESEETDLLDEIDCQEWDTTIKRRVQHYGFRFQYSKLNVDKDTPIREFPPLCQAIQNRSELNSYGFNQLTINEYVPGVGIASHCDTHSAFTDTIAVVSLGSPITMDFVSACNSKRVSVRIPPRSLFLMTGESRYGWRHGIASRKTDVECSGDVVNRGRRVSLTFRQCIDGECSCLFPSLCNSQGSDTLRPRRMQVG